MTLSAGSEQPQFDIAVAGLGVVSVHHFTTELRECIRRCQQVFVLDSGYGVDAHLRELCPQVTSLDSLYTVNESRRHAYRRMAATVVAAAIEEPPVCFATYGHPRVFCYPATLIQRAARLLDLRLRVLAGISALDTLLIDVDYDFSADGLQMYDATDLLLRQRPLQPDVPCVLWQTTVIADPTHHPGQVPAERFSGLQNYLLRFYPPHHEVLAVFSRTHPALRSIIHRHQLASLATGLAEGAQSGTLFIPASTARPVATINLNQSVRVTHE